MRHSYTSTLALLAFLTTLTACTTPGTPGTGSSPSPSPTAVPSAGPSQPAASPSASVSTAPSGGGNTFTVVSAKLDGEALEIPPVVNRSADDNYASIAVGGTVSGSVPNGKFMIILSLNGKDRNPTAPGFTTADLSDFSWKANKADTAKYGAVAKWITPKTKPDIAQQVTIADGKLSFTFSGPVDASLTAFSGETHQLELTITDIGLAP